MSFLHSCQNPQGCKCSQSQDQPKNEPSRRLFLALLGGLAGAILIPSQAWAKKLAIGLGALPALQKVGGWVVAKIKNRDILFIRNADPDVTAITPFCTHQGYLLQYDAANHVIVCKKHGSHFDLKGNVLKGPAKKRLTPRYWTKLEKDKGRILIKLD